MYNPFHLNRIDKTVKPNFYVDSVFTLLHFWQDFLQFGPFKDLLNVLVPKLSTEEKKIVFQEDATLQVIRLHQTTKHVKDVEML